jgi:hypothetical protein
MLEGVTFLEMKEVLGSVGIKIHEAAYEDPLYGLMTWKRGKGLDSARIGLRGDLEEEVKKKVLAVLSGLLIFLPRRERDGLGIPYAEIRKRARREGTDLPRGGPGLRVLVVTEEKFKEWE